MKRKIVAIFVGLFIISGVLIGIIFASAQADEKHAATEEMGILILPTEGVRIHALQVDIDSFKYAETEEEKEKVLVNLEHEDAEEVQELLRYEDETAGSIMTKEFISFGLNVTVEETVEILKEMQPDEEVMYYIYVTDEEDKIKGLVILRDLLLSDGKKKLSELMEENITTVKHTESIEEVIDKAAKYDLLSTAVVDEDNRLIGIVLIHDIIDEEFYPLWKKKNKSIK